MKLMNWVPLIVSVALVGMIASMQVSADSDEHDGRERYGHEQGEGGSEGGRSRVMPTNEAWKTECSACHMAYPPAGLPADSWKAIMGGLDDHFGSDASLDEATMNEISTFLQENAGRQRGPAPAEPVLRLTETNWFKRQHHEISSQVWKRESIKSASNCAACHTQAEQGNFDEDWVKIPRK